jgi:hypothetical protein
MGSRTSAWTPPSYPKEFRLDASERSQFVGAYTKLLTSAWSDEAFMQRVKSDPKPVLEEVGLSVPAGATVNVSNSQGEGSLDEQVRLWEEGQTSGTITLYVPDVPKIDTAELSESELAGVAGGDDSYCCCCSPCCTCT